MLASNLYLKIIFLFGRPSHNTCIGKILGVFMDVRSRFCGIPPQMIMSLSKDELWVLKESWNLIKVFGHVGRKGIGNTLIRIQSRRCRFEIFSLFYEFSYFHLFAFSSVENPIWKRLPFKEISTFYGNINTWVLGFHMALAYWWVPKFSYIFVYLVITLLLMKF